MIVLISPEQTTAKEIDVLNKLFHAGLNYYHLRKPDATLEEHCNYLDLIDPDYLDCVMVHNFHEELTTRYAINGVHLEEAKWRAQGDNLQVYTSNFQLQGFSVSASYHEPEDLVNEAVAFDYLLLSPVFAAISKSDMKGRGFNVKDIDKEIIGMGGINATTAPQALDLGFAGVGVLGGVWNATDAVQALKDLQQVVEE